MAGFKFCDSRARAPCPPPFYQRHPTFMQIEMFYLFSAYENTESLFF